jgi:hypothetical protein
MALTYLIVGIVIGITVVGEVVVIICEHKHKDVPKLFRFIAKNSYFSFMRGKDNSKEREKYDRNEQK